MKSVLVYSPYWSSLGGGEKYMLALAEVLASMPGVSVEILSCHRSIDKGRLERYFHIDLSHVTFSTIESEREVGERSKESDLSVIQSNVREVPSFARRRAQVFQIPYGPISALTIGAKISRGLVVDAAKDLRRLRLIRSTRTGANLVLVYSEFVSNALERIHRIQSRVLYPPIQDFRREGFSRKNIILSVGRFFSGLYNDKRYDVLTAAFRNARGLAGWEYHIAGSADDTPATQKLLRSLQEINREAPIVFHVNESYDALCRLYNEARILWHGAGYGVDERQRPENTEHFGMTTVEAMSAGCIPIVVNNGGQREIVTDGVNGYLWSSSDELIERTESAMRDTSSLQKMQAAARTRFEDFRQERFRQRVYELFTPLLG